jgi:hypothetical protein
MKYLTIFALLSALYLNVFSQTVDSSNLKPKNSLTKGSWSIQFEVGLNLQIHAFEELAISLKRHNSKEHAVRFGVGLRIRETDDDVKHLYIDSSRAYGTLNQRFYSAVITGNYLIYPHTDGDINLYFGFGPRGTYSYRKDEYLLLHLNSYVSKGWSAGINGVVGCEWFAVHYISFFAEYNANAQYVQNDVDRITYGDNRTVLETYTTNSKGFEFSGNTAKLGLSLYF